MCYSGTVWRWFRWRSCKPLKKKKSLPSLTGVNIILERLILASSDLFILAFRDYITHRTKTISLRDPYLYQASRHQLMVYINLPGGTAPTWLLKRSIIPNICILISSVTLTRTPVNKAINQRRVRVGIRGEGGFSGAVCVWWGWIFYPGASQKEGRVLTNIWALRPLEMVVMGKKLEMWNARSCWPTVYSFYTTYIMTIKA